MPEHRFPPPWSVDEADSKLDRRASSSAMLIGRRSLYIYFEGELDRRSAAHLLTHHEARRIAANIAKLQEMLSKAPDLYRPTSVMTSTPDISLHCAHGRHGPIAEVRNEREGS
jgi:hypothetical protein